LLPPIAKRLLDGMEIPPDGLEHEFERRRVHWFENAIFETSLLAVDQGRGRGAEFSEQFISASGRGSCPKTRAIGRALLRTVMTSLPMLGCGNGEPKRRVNRPRRQAWEDSFADNRNAARNAALRSVGQVTVT
jgi:hypothetical protein